MKKLLTTVLLFVSMLSYSIEYNTYEMDIEHVFKSSHEGENDTYDLSIFRGDSNPGADGPGIFFIEEQLVISDQAYYRNDRRTIFLDKNYDFDKIYNESFYQMVIIQSNYIYIGYNPSKIKGFNLNDKWGEKFNILVYDFEVFRGYKDLYYQDNTLFIYDKDYKLWAIKDPGLDIEKNKKNIIKEDEIIKEIKSEKYIDLKIDENKNLIYKNFIATVQYKKFINYLSKINNQYAGSINGFTYDYKTLAKFNMDTYIGSDKDGNKYWCSNRTIIVIGLDGSLKDIFRYNYELSDTYPAVSPAGDVFFMNYGEDRVTLYKVKRQW